MEQLTIVGTEDDKLVLVSESGARFSVAIDSVLRGAIKPHGAREEAKHRASPRDIQAQVRAGLSASEVAELLGITVDDVQRYAAPVLAEREHVVDQALAVPVLIGTEVEPDGSLSFGTAIRAKLAETGATAEQWTSWKSEDGWVIKLTFTADEIDYDARWSFDPRRSTLVPQNSSATQLSRQGSLPEGLIPRLRALEPERAAWKDDSRFDSGAFGPRRLPEPAVTDAQSEADDTPRSSARPTAADAAVNRAPEAAPATSTDTADLLEALRRRRGQREPAPSAEQQAPSTSVRAAAEPVALFEADDLADDAEIAAEKHAAAEQAAGRRRGRTSMPSWDEIVFGAKTDD